jgi:hypothetical protein
MPEDFSHLSGEERLKAENEFLKMKLMLEKGAQFGIESDVDLPAEAENEFLKNMIAFEAQFDAHKTIRVFDKIERPSHFRSAADIPDEEIDKAWRELAGYLHRYGITLDVCSPNIPVRELYRFTVEELFEHEMDDINMPGMIHGFIYDEFHPDPVYDNTRAATGDCINYILQKEPMEWTHHFQNEDLRLNEHYPLTIDELKNIANRFKDAYDSLEIENIAGSGCAILENNCWVSGTYSVHAASGSEIYQLSGDWTVRFVLNKELGYWYITEVKIDGINF